ncbi:MAG: nitronate monooxygenase [Deltaproteobacteria bacterium]|nr:nitronate monooxygenase [Deltaproteobacteria bacterium]
MDKPFKTKITEMLAIDYPILMGGMQWISRAEFVAHACNAGILGFITAESFETPEALREDLRKMRDLTDRPFGVNISMIPELGDLKGRTYQLADVVCEENVPVVETAGRSPGPLMDRFKAAGVKVIHKLTSVRHAMSAQKAGVDAIALLGFGSGGHIGLEEVASFISLPQAIEQLDIPVLAAGGVADGRGFLGALAMGAEGILMGTRFMITRECPIHEEIKARYVKAQAHETVLLMKSIQNPMRSIRNRFAEDLEAMEARGTTLEEIIQKVAGTRSKRAYVDGDPETSLLPTGQVVGLIKGVKTVKEVVDDVIREAVVLRERLAAMAS